MKGMFRSISGMDGTWGNEIPGHSCISCRGDVTVRRNIASRAPSREGTRGEPGVKTAIKGNKGNRAEAYFEMLKAEKTYLLICNNNQECKKSSHLNNMNQVKYLKAGNIW